MVYGDYRLPNGALKFSEVSPVTSGKTQTPFEDANEVTVHQNVKQIQTDYLTAELGYPYFVCLR